MKHWWQYDSDEGRIKYIKWVRKINEYPNYYIDYEFEAEAVENLSLQGKIAYFKGEMRKLIAGGDKKGPLVRSWIKDDKCKIFPNVEKEILKLWNQNKKEIEENWTGDLEVSFDKQLHAFFKIYFPYVKLVKLLAECQRQSEGETLLGMVNDQMRKKFEQNLETLFENDFHEWGQGEFSAACYHIYHAKESFKWGNNRAYINKMEAKSFEAFKRELASYFNRKAPSHNIEKSKKEFEKLTLRKKILLKSLFS